MTLLIAAALGSGCASTGPATGADEAAAVPRAASPAGAGGAATSAEAAPAAADGAGTAPVTAATPASGATAAGTARPRAGNAPFYVVKGQRYYVLAAAEGYRERGIASWYGRKFHGRRTASGEIYDMHAMTAAHKTLPIPSRVRVRNMRNGREVVVRVNDRGPFVKGRLIDLSYEAARRLDLIQDGTGMVEVSLLPEARTGTERPVPAVQTASAPADGSGGIVPGPPLDDGSAVATTATPVRVSAGAYQRFYLQVGAYGDPANAERMRTRLRSLGFGNVEIQHAAAAEPAYRVRVGPFADASAYDAAVEQLQTADIVDTFLTVP